MSEFHLTEEQRAVVESDADRLVVTASAGAGKTRVLVERYLRHVVEEGIGPDAILTITFTKKAAAEMKSRIVTALRSRGLYDEAQIAETGPIQTIHSFCERLLRENALAAGLDPAYEVLDDAESSRLVTACIREALASDLEEEPYAERLVAHLAGRSPAGAEARGRSPYARLEDEVRNVLSALRGSGTSILEMRQHYAEPEALSTFWEASMIERLEPEVAAALANVDAPSLQERLHQAHRAVGARAPWCTGKPDPVAEAQALEHACGLVQLACAAWWRLEREMLVRQTLDFAELENRAVDLLRRRPEVRTRVQAQFSVAMVDEDQDVNPQQDRLFESLGIRRTLEVGDAQQSIYSFRLADVDRFRAKVALGALPLTRNWRSEAGILRFVDRIFSQQWPEYAPMAPRLPFSLDGPSFDEDCTGVEIWRHAAPDPNATAAYIRELIDEGENPGDIAVLVRGANTAQRIKTGLDGEGIPSRIAGGAERFYTRLEVRDLSNTLRATADPYDDFALLAALRSPMVDLSLDAIVHLAADGIGVIDRLDPAQLPNSEDRQKLSEFLTWYEPLRRVADRLPAGEALAEILARSPFLANMARREDGAQSVANARKLLSLALREPTLGPSEYAERIWEIQEVRHKEGDAPADAANDVVTLMTIHKSKGLEFPVVVVPETKAPFKGASREIAIDPRISMVTVKPGKVPCLAHRFIEARNEARDKEEGLRLLYVALTRAQRRLCVAVYPPDVRDSANKVLQNLLKTGIPPGVRVRDAMAQPMAA